MRLSRQLDPEDFERHYETCKRIMAFGDCACVMTCTNHMMRHTVRNKKLADFWGKLAKGYNDRL